MEEYKNTKVKPTYKTGDIVTQHISEYVENMLKAQEALINKKDPEYILDEKVNYE